MKQYNKTSTFRAAEIQTERVESGKYTAFKVIWSLQKEEVMQQNGKPDFQIFWNVFLAQDSE